MSGETMMEAASKLRLTLPADVKRKRKKRISTSKQVRGNRWLITLFKAQGETCYYCRKIMVWDKRPDSTNPRRATLEHKTPLSRGGLHAKSNCCAACAGCNKRKATMTEEEYKESLHDH